MLPFTENTCWEAGWENWKFQISVLFNSVGTDWKGPWVFPEIWKASICCYLCCCFLPWPLLVFPLLSISSQLSIEKGCSMYIFLQPLQQTYEINVHLYFILSKQSLSEVKHCWITLLSVLKLIWMLEQRHSIIPVPVFFSGPSTYSISNHLCVKNLGHPGLLICKVWIMITV